MQDHDHIDLGHADMKGDADRSSFPERRNFDRLLMPFSARCLTAPPDQLDREIEQGLHEVNSFFCGDRVILWGIADDEQTAVITHYHFKSGATKPQVNSFLRKALPYIFGSVRELKNLCVSSLEELPPDALLDRQYLERSGIQSFMVIPLMVGGALRGALSLACLQTGQAWSAEDLSRFQRIGSVLSSALDRKRSYYLLERRIQFETLITNLSAQLIKASMNKLDGEIERALVQVREFFQADRCALLDIRADGKFSWLTHVSDGEGVEPVPRDINLAEIFPWCYEQLIQGKNINICHVEDYPEEAVLDRQSQVAFGIKSALIFPLAVGGSISKIIVINHTRRHQLWPEEYIPRLRLLGDIFVNALVRREDRLKLEEQLRFETLLSEISTRFISLPAEQIDNTIQEAQFHICELLDLDRSSLWQVPEENPDTMLLTNLHQPPESPPAPVRMDGMDFFPWVVRKVLDGGTVIISKLTDLPPEADRDLESFRAFGTKSTVLVPLSVGEEPALGLLGFAVLGEERGWTETAVMGFKLIAQIFANALARKRADKTLRESEARLSLTTDAVGAGLWSMEVDTRRIWVSPKSRELFYFAPDEEIYYESYFKVIHSEDRDRVHREVQQAIQSGEELLCDYRIIRPDGTIRWIASRAKCFLKSAGAPERLMGLSLDITERKQAEAALHELSGLLIHAHEEERARLARELHDDVTQRLARMAIDVGLVQIGADGVSAADMMRSVCDGLMRLSEDIHSLSYQLHPSLLEDLGLAEALRSECERFSRQESTAIDLNLQDLPAFIPTDTALCLFRVAQEALRNVARHAQANKIKVSMQTVDGGLQLMILDDGIGFESTAPRDRHSLGLASMRERIHLLGGELEIKSTPGKGTTILARAPLKKGQS